MSRLRAPTTQDHASILALNNAHLRELGELNARSLGRLLEIAFHARVIGEGDAFLIALEQGAPYDSPNYRWFSERFARFAYIDRVAVAASARKRGLARQLYEDLIAAAARAGHAQLACEVNYDPPNPGSDAFHEALGFHEIGRATLPERGKSVRYLLRDL